MKKPFLTSLLFLPIFLIAQERTTNFTLDLLKEKVPNSLYDSIEFIDTRYDTTYFGHVQLGLFNDRAKVIAKESVSTQLNKVLDNMTDSHAGKGKLLFALRRFTFLEVTKATSETGFCYVRATLFAKSNSGYKVINYLDTIVQFRAMDVTQRLLNTGSKLLTEFVRDNLTALPAEERNYSFDETWKLDSIEKTGIPIYVSNAFKDGVYKDYNEFKNQSPGISTFTAVYKKEKLNKISIMNAEGQEKEMDADEYYAVVHDGKPYVSTRYGYYPMVKRGDNFYYTGKMRKNNPGMAMMFGLIGAMIASSETEIVEHRLDHVTGNFLYAGRAK
jgi:hypothetical protein